MPKIARVQLADGRVARLEVPDDYTPAQALTAAKQHIGGPKAASRPNSGVGLVDQALSSINEAAIGFGEGIYNAASAVTDPIAKKIVSLVSGNDAAEQAMSQAKGGRRSVVDAASNAVVSRPSPAARVTGRIAGSLAIPLPGKKLQEGGRLAKTAYRAMQGAVGGAAVREVDEDAAAPAAIGAATNVVIPPVLSALVRSAPAQAAVKPIQRLLGLDAARLAPPTAAFAPLGRKAEARAARFKASGVDKPTTGMVTRNPAAFSFERNTAPIVGFGDDLASQIRDVEEGLVKRGRELVGKAGGAKGAEVTGKGVQEALDAKRNEMQQVTSRLYEKVRETRGDESVGSLENLGQLVGDPDMTDNAVFDEMRTSLIRRLERLGGAVNVRQAEEFRKFIGGLGSNMEPGVRMMRGRLIDALDDDVVEAVGDDAFKAARASAKARFAEFKKTFAGKIADEGVAPELLTKRVLSDTTSFADLRAMRESLLKGTDEQAARGKEAWKGLQGQAIGDLLSKSTNEEGKLLGGQLARDFVKQSAKLRELMEPRDYVELRRLVLASRDATVAPPGSSVNHSGTAITLANMFQSTKPKVQAGWFKLIGKFGAKHAAAGAISFPFGNIALVAGENLSGKIAENKAAELLMRRVRMAQSPEETAAAITAMKQAAESNPAIARFLEKNGALTGGLAAASQ